MKRWEIRNNLPKPNFTSLHVHWRRHWQRLDAHIFAFASLRSFNKYASCATRASLASSYSHFASIGGTTSWPFVTFDWLSFDWYMSIKCLVCKVFPTKCTSTHEQTLTNLRKCHWWNWNGCRIIMTTFILIKVHVLT